jgi:hypothetical protein
MCLSDTPGLQPRQISIVKAVTAKQHALGIYGAVGEIGVHHGKFLIPIVGNALSSEPAVALDLFEDQTGNVDTSGEHSGTPHYGIGRIHAIGADIQQRKHQQDTTSSSTISTTTTTTTTGRDSQTCKHVATTSRMQPYQLGRLM